MRLWAPVLLYMALIFAISSISHPPELPDAVGDKGGHALLYSGLAALFVRAFARGWSKPPTLGISMAAVVGSTLYGVTDEIHQMFVPPRTPEVADVVADAIGAAAAVAALYAVHAVRSRFHS
jgi:VanZ family protein